jgi:hypothetical protein
MALRPFQANRASIRENALDYEIVQEQAAALGRLGRALERALRAYDAAKAGSNNELTLRPPTPQAARMQLLAEASYALWCFIVQREACGLRDQQALLREYRVPAEVHNRVGIFGGNRSRQSR